MGIREGAIGIKVKAATGSGRLPELTVTGISPNPVSFARTLAGATVQQCGGAAFGDGNGIGIGHWCLVTDRGDGDADRGIRGLAVIVGDPVGETDQRSSLIRYGCKRRYRQRLR